MQKYEVRLKPTIHNNSMQYHWKIFLINDEGVFTIKHGWHEHLSDAMLNAASAASALQISW